MSSASRRASRDYIHGSIFKSPPVDSKSTNYSKVSDHDVARALHSFSVLSVSSVVDIGSSPAQPCGAISDPVMLSSCGTLSKRQPEEMGGVEPVDRRRAVEPVHWGDSANGHVLSDRVVRVTKHQRGAQN
jgi:hypothetical protein